jgi:hypothetical protein
MTWDCVKLLTQLRGVIHKVNFFKKHVVPALLMCSLTGFSFKKLFSKIPQFGIIGFHLLQCQHICKSPYVM